MGHKRGHKETLTGRERLKRRLRKRIVGSIAKPRLSVFKSGRHTYVQAVADDDGRTLAAASTMEPALRDLLLQLEFKEEPRSRSLKSTSAARAVGLLAAERILKLGIKEVVFDRNGFWYHGRVKAVADGAREGGLVF